MRKKPFDPKQWLDEPTGESVKNAGGSATSKVRQDPSNQQGATGQQPASMQQQATAEQQVEQAVQALESQAYDLTKTYSNWVELGFALSELGESGRDYFHRISRFHPEYERQACDRQYDHCLKSGGSGIHLATFFHYVKQAGIEWRPSAAGIPMAFMEPGEGIGEQAEVQSAAEAMLAEAEYARLNPDLPSASEALLAQTPSGNGQGSVPSAAQAMTAEAAFGDPQTQGRSASEVLGSSGALSGGDSEENAAGAIPEQLERETDLVAAGKAWMASLPEQKWDDLPVLPDEVYKQLPAFLKEVVAPANSKQERDLLLLGSLTVLSSALPNVYSLHDNLEVFPNLYLFVTAPASAGKGKLNFTRELVLPIHRELRKQSQEAKDEYEAELAQVNASGKGEKPKRPGEKMLFLPANSSATGMLELLAENDCRGLIFETEGDTLSQTFRTDYGNYSDSFRKAFHHETISYYRRTEKEHRYLEHPKLSAVLSGTPKQVKTLIESPENGLFSRFAFYQLNLKLQWRNVFSRNNPQGLRQHYEQLGLRFAHFHKALKGLDRLRIDITPAQEQQFNEHFIGQQYKYMQLQPFDFAATVFRMGLIFLRIAMVLSALRIMEEGLKENNWVCREADGNTALKITEILLMHSSHVFYGLPVTKDTNSRHGRREWLLNSLPAQFCFKEAYDLAQLRYIPKSTLERDLLFLVKMGLLRKSSRNNYRQPKK